MTSNHPGLPHDFSRQHASPSARRIAREKNIDLTGISGTGPNGRICKRDVLAAIHDSDTPCLYNPNNPKTPAVQAHFIPNSISELTADVDIQYSKIRQATADRLTLKANRPYRIFTFPSMRI